MAAAHLCKTLDSCTSSVWQKPCTREKKPTVFLAGADTAEGPEPPVVKGGSLPCYLQKQMLGTRKSPQRKQLLLLPAPYKGLRGKVTLGSGHALPLPIRWQRPWLFRSRERTIRLKCASRWSGHALLAMARPRGRVCPGENNKDSIHRGVRDLAPVPFTAFLCVFETRTCQTDTKLPQGPGVRGTKRYGMDARKRRRQGSFA